MTNNMPNLTAEALQALNDPDVKEAIKKPQLITQTNKEPRGAREL